MTRLCMLLAALAVIARARVAVLPGWTVPVPALILAAEVLLFTAAMAWLALRTPRLRPLWHAPGQGRGAR